MDESVQWYDILTRVSASTLMAVIHLPIIDLLFEFSYPSLYIF